MSTYTPKPGDITRQWHVIDATDLVLGRLASQAAILLRGKHKPYYALHIDTGDFVVIINAANIVMTGNKAEQSRVHRQIWGSRRPRTTRRRSRSSHPVTMEWWARCGATRSGTGRAS